MLRAKGAVLRGWRKQFTWLAVLPRMMAAAADGAGSPWECEHPARTGKEAGLPRAPTRCAHG